MMIILMTMKALIISLKNLLNLLKKN